VICNVVWIAGNHSRSIVTSFHSLVAMNKNKYKVA